MTTTGLQEVYWTSKRVVGVSDWRDRIFQKAIKEIRALATATFRDGGVFATLTGLAADGNDKFKLTPLNDATDGVGHLFTPTTALANGIKFENANTVPYSVGLHYAQRPRGYAQNPMTGMPDILALEDTIGEQAAPSSVVDNGDGTLTMIVDSVAEPGVSNAGRSVVAWKLVPGVGANSEALCVETLTVVWDGSNNKVTTAHNFGQGVTPSTAAADYNLTLLGPSVRRHTNLSLTAGYAFIGTVTGAGAGSPPSTFSTAGQNVIDSTLADFNQITRINPHGFVKVSVQADVSDSPDNQIEVKDTTSAVVFSVDDHGNVVVHGNLTVQGTETVQNTETVNTTLIVGDSAQLGDDDSDSHTVKGTWQHVFGGASIAFKVDGTTGHVGVGGAPGTVNLKVTGTSEFTGLATFDTNVDVTAQVSCDILFATTAIACDGNVNAATYSDVIPLANDSNLGSATGPKRWKLQATTANFLGDATFQAKALPAADNANDIGNSTTFWRNAFAYSLTLKDDPATTATGQKNRLSKPMPSKAWVHFTLTQSAPGADPTITILDGVNIAGVLCSGATASSGSVRVSVADVFADTKYIAVPEVVRINGQTFGRRIRPIDTDGTNAKTSGTHPFLVSVIHDAPIVPAVGTNIVIEEPVDLRNLGAETVEVYVAFWGRQ